MKRFFALALALACLLALSGCAPSPTAVTVGGRKVDASEYAFYLHYNCDAHEDASVPYSDAETAAAREKALKQIVTGEIVRLKCEKYGLTLSKAATKKLKSDKAALIDSLGGKAAYVDYLRESCLTDRAYDKFQQGAVYYQMLYDYIAKKTDYTDEALRQYFADSFLTLKYIRFPTVDESGAPLSDSALAAVRTEAESVLARAQSGEDFDTLVQTYGGAANGSTGMIVSKLEAIGIDYLENAFLLDPNTVDGLYECSDGLYILERLPLDATYYEENQDYIRQSALDLAFSQKLDEWKKDAKVSVSDVVDDITLNNVHDYVK